MKIKIRAQRLSDAERFFEILSNHNFEYLPAKPQTLEEEIDFLKKNPRKRKNKTEYNFSIIYDGTLVGAVGLRIDQFRPYIGEVGYFVDEKYWGKGIATSALRELEQFIATKTEVKRIELRMAIKNTVSEAIAIKCGYKKEGLLRNMLQVDGTWHDCWLYSKLILG